MSDGYSEREYENGVTFDNGREVGNFPDNNNNNKHWDVGGGFELANDSGEDDGEVENGLNGNIEEQWSKCKYR